MTRDICMFCGIQRTQQRRCATQKIAAERDEANRRGDGLAADLATCVRLRDQALTEVERLRAALETAKEACRLNLVYVGMKDEHVLLHAFEVAEAALAGPSHAKDGAQ